MISQKLTLRDMKV